MDPFAFTLAVILFLGLPVAIWDCYRDTSKVNRERADNEWRSFSQQAQRLGPANYKAKRLHS